MMGRQLLGAALGVGALGVVLLSACADSLDAGSVTATDSGPGSAFVPAEDAEASVALSLCVDTACRPGFATCVNAQGTANTAPCTVDLKNDSENCGACGRSCDASGSNTCKDGFCILTCSDSLTDCNNLAEDGCEIDISQDHDHCGDCKTACAPSAFCVQGKCECPPTQVLLASGDCGCPTGQTNCDGTCADLTSDDLHCGSCTKECAVDKLVGGSLVGINGKKLPPHTHTGCSNSTCTRVKCDGALPAPAWSDCNGSLPADLAKADPSTGDGCEVDVLADFNPNDCGKCNVKCAPGAACFGDYASQSIICECPSGQTKCATPQDQENHLGRCVDLQNELLNCGVCGNACSGPFGGPPHTVSACERGACATTCEKSYADCNAESDDGCEVNLLSDPRNCGACGNTCDIAAGQPCTNGVCATKPCPVVTK